MRNISGGKRPLFFKQSAVSRICRALANEFANYRFDAASRITGITQNLWASRTVTGGVGTGTATLTELYQTPLSWSISYDNRSRLTGFNRAGAETSYSYDANSNRLTAIDKTSSDTDLNDSFDADDFSQTSSQALNIEGSSNKLLGFSQTHSKTKGSQALATTSSLVSYSLDANGNLTHDGRRSFDYDEANRLEKVKLLKDGEEAAIRYLHNALGQRVFKGEPQAESYQPNEAELGQDFISWLKKNFQWLFARAQANSSLGTAYVYGDEQLPEWAVLGDYDNGSATGKGRTEYIWLPTEDQTAIPVGMYRNGRFFAIHTDHLGTPRLITNEQNQPVWQWPYSAFGNNKPTGVLKATTNPKAAMMNSPTLLRATNPAAEFDLRYPGQMADSETGQFYNYFRSYQPGMGRYTQADPIGLNGGWNVYAYANGAPTMYIDPSGLAPSGTWQTIFNEVKPPTWSLPSPISVVNQSVGAVVDFGQGYGDMMDATYGIGKSHKGWANQDKYFHCRANCEAAQRGSSGQCVARNISDSREWFDQTVKGDPASASAADQVANAYGRQQGAVNPAGSCKQLCGIYRPGGSFPAGF